ncbi:MFS transporter [Defluviimonas sp. SAOS-178_SWC]|uniref:MFS transporter n=1 Tax=Defluviimonas sp. SAOS-178_SWC TaxID=3121287 RepID=UPI00322204FE
MAILRAAVLAQAPNAGLAAVGVLWGAFAALVPDIKARIAAPDAAFGLAMMMSAIGGIAAMALAPRLMARLGRFGLPVAGVLLSVAFFYPLLARDALGFGLAMVAIGASVSLLDIGANMRLSVLEDRHGLHLMNFSHAMFSFAFAASALVASLARQAGHGPADVLPVLSLVALVLAAAMRERRGWSGAAPAPDGADRRTPWGPILLCACILLAAFVSENATETWSSLHIERTLGGPAGNGGFGPVAFGLTMGLGRLGGQVAAERFGEAGLVLWSAVIGVIGAVVIAAAPVPAVAVLGVGLLGLGVAVTVPSANSILGRLVRPDQRAHAISRAWMIGFTGFFIGPTAMGAIAQTAGLRTAFLTVALIMAAIVPLVVALNRRGG